MNLADGEVLARLRVALAAGRWDVFGIDQRLRVVGRAYVVVAVAAGAVGHLGIAHLRGDAVVGAEVRLHAPGQKAVALAECLVFVTVRAYLGYVRRVHRRIGTGV